MENKKLLFIGVALGVALTLGGQALHAHDEAEAYRIEASMQSCQAELERFTWGYCEVDYNGDVQIHHNNKLKMEN